MTPETPQGRRILVDWGTSNFRAFLVESDGRVIDRRQSAMGVLSVPPGGFRDALLREIGTWMQADVDLPVLMCGMVGSRQGWVEVAYVDCPANPGDLARAMVAPDADDSSTLIVPGLRRRSATGHFDVMRGEETQTLGALVLSGAEGAPGDGLYCLPGTHSKWVSVEGGRIVGFTTAMTGELFAILRENSILAKSMDRTSGVDEAAFDAGLTLSQEGGGLSSHLFSLRADALMGLIPSTSATSYLSGILIGHEIAGRRLRIEDRKVVTLVGSPELAFLYRRALEKSGIRSLSIDAESATIRGLLRLAQARTEPARPLTDDSADRRQQTRRVVSTGPMGPVASVDFGQRRQAPDIARRPRLPARRKSARRRRDNSGGTQVLREAAIIAQILGRVLDHELQDAVVVLQRHLDDAPEHHRIGAPRADHIVQGLQIDVGAPGGGDCLRHDSGRAEREEIVDQLDRMGGTHRAHVENLVGKALQHRTDPQERIGIAAHHQGQLSRFGLLGCAGHRRIDERPPRPRPRRRDPWSIAAAPSSNRRSPAPASCRR
jgi:2-dehydro-3-deoxygalactonokinase